MQTACPTDKLQIVTRIFKLRFTWHDAITYSSSSGFRKKSSGNFSRQRKPTGEKIDLDIMQHWKHSSVLRTIEHILATESRK